jgi:hypothetical protein
MGPLAAPCEVRSPGGEPKTIDALTLAHGHAAPPHDDCIVDGRARDRRAILRDDPRRSTCVIRRVPLGWSQAEVTRRVRRGYGKRGVRKPGFTLIDPRFRD